MPGLHMLGLSGISDQTAEMQDKKYVLSTASELRLLPCVLSAVVLFRGLIRSSFGVDNSLATLPTLLMINNKPLCAPAGHRPAIFANDGAVRRAGALSRRANPRTGRWAQINGVSMRCQGHWT